MGYFMMIYKRPAMHAKKGRIGRMSSQAVSLSFLGWVVSQQLIMWWLNNNCALLSAHKFLHFMMFFNTCNLMNAMIFFPQGCQMQVLKRPSQRPKGMIQKYVIWLYANRCFIQINNFAQKSTWWCHLSTNTRIPFIIS